MLYQYAIVVPSSLAGAPAHRNTSSMCSLPRLHLMSASTATVTPGVVSPRRAVPPGIARPEYVDKAAPAPFAGSEVKDTETIERMRTAGRIAAEALAEAGRAVAPGVSTEEVDRVGHEYLLDHGAYPST